MSPAEVGTELGARLKARRLALCMPQQELAARAGISVGTVKNLEGKTGACAVHSLIRVAVTLGLIDHFEQLFVVRPKSIAQMEQRAGAPRLRARRKRALGSSAPR